MWNLRALSSLTLFTKDANTGKEDAEGEVDGGEEGEEEEEVEEEDEEETGRDEDVEARLSLQLSESLPLHAFPVWAAHDWRRTKRHCDSIKYKPVFLSSANSGTLYCDYSLLSSHFSPSAGEVMRHKTTSDQIFLCSTQLDSLCIHTKLQ